MAAKDIVPIAIIGGVQGNVEDQLKTKLDVVDNLVYTKRGGLSPRYGTAPRFDGTTVPVNGTASLATPETLATYGNESIRIGQNILSAYSDVLDTRVVVGKVPECVVEYETVVSSGNGILYPDVAIGNGYTVYAYSDFGPGNGPTNSYWGTVRVSIVDTATNTCIQNLHTLDTNGMYAKVLFVGTVAWVFWLDESQAIQCSSYDTATQGPWSSTVSIVTGPIASEGTELAPYDVILYGSNFYVAYAIGSPPVYTIDMVDSTSLALNATGTSALSLPSGTEVYSISIAAGLPNLWLVVGFRTTADYMLYMTRFDLVPGGPTLTEQISPVLIASTVVPAARIRIASAIGTVVIDGSTDLAIVAERRNLGVYSYRYDTSGSQVYESKCGNEIIEEKTPFKLRSKPWNQDGRIYALVEIVHTAGNSLVVCDVSLDADRTNSLFRAVANIAPRQIGCTGNVRDVSIHPLSSIARTGNNDVTMCVSGSLDAATSIGSVISIAVKFNVPRQVVEANSIALISGGVPTVYDGVALSEASYLTFGDVIVVTNQGPGGSQSAGAYSYRVVPEWKDGRGNVVRGAPSAAVTVTLAASDFTLIEFDQLYLTNRFSEVLTDNPVSRTIYRTIADGTTYYRLTVLPPTSETINDATTSYTGFYDDIGDSVLLARNQLYTNVGDTIIDNVCPPSARYVTLHKNRFWLAGTPDDSIWYSKTNVVGTGPAFNEVLTIPRFDGGRVTGIVSLDAYLVIFKRRSVWVVTGNGNDETGAGSDLAEPFQITNDIGCIDFRSIVVDPVGVYFQSERGIYRITRNSNEVVFIGEDVKDFTQEFGSQITSAVLVPAQNQIRFTRIANDASLSNTLIYDTLNNCWTTASYHDSVTNGQLGATSATIRNGVYEWVTASGQEYIEDSESYLDHGSFYMPRTLTTAWINLTSVQGYQRVSRIQMLGVGHESFAVRCDQFNDFQPTAAVATSRQSPTIASDTPYQIEYLVSRQRSQSIKVKLFFDAPSVSYTTGQGMTINSIVLLAHAYRGKFHQPSSHR